MANTLLGVSGAIGVNPLSRTGRCIDGSRSLPVLLSFELHGAEVTDGRVQPLCIVNVLDEMRSTLLNTAAHADPGDAAALHLHAQMNGPVTYSSQTLFLRRKSAPMRDRISP